MDERPVRVSDAEREQTVVLLREHLLAGRLTPEEFEARAEAALAARVGTDLARIQDDLPRPAAAAGWTAAVTAFADVDFDLREAIIDRPQTTMVILAVCGNIDVYVPAGVTVDVSGLTLFGHRRDWGNDVTAPRRPHHQRPGRRRLRDHRHLAGPGHHARCHAARRHPPPEGPAAPTASQLEVRVGGWSGVGLMDALAWRAQTWVTYRHPA
jgi:Domain of unknown function (DUF1707)/Cell wall-active antibiotics response 4TMS YvqF